MRPIGFSTGALALADYRLALSMVADTSDVQAIELSALRAPELTPLTARNGNTVHDGPPANWDEDSEVSF